MPGLLELESIRVRRVKRRITRGLLSAFLILQQQSDHRLSFPLCRTQAKEGFLGFKLEDGLIELIWEPFLEPPLVPGHRDMQSSVGI